MGIRTAVRDNGMFLMPFFILLGLAWIVITTLNVWASIDYSNLGVDQYVGHAAVSGIVGVAVLVLTALVSVYLYAEAGETGPRPEGCPPRKR